MMHRRWYTYTFIYVLKTWGSASADTQYKLTQQMIKIIMLLFFIIFMKITNNVCVKNKCITVETNIVWHRFSTKTTIVVRKYYENRNNAGPVPPLKPHILFYSNGLAIEHSLPNIRNMKVDNFITGKNDFKKSERKWNELRYDSGLLQDCKTVPYATWITWKLWCNKLLKMVLQYIIKLKNGVNSTVDSTLRVPVLP